MCLQLETALPPSQSAQGFNVMGGKEQHIVDLMEGCGKCALIGVSTRLQFTLQCVKERKITHSGT